MKKRILSLLLALIMILGMFPTTALATDAPVSVTVNGEAVTVSKQGDFSDSQWGWYSIPVYYAQVPEDATFSIDCSGGADSTYRPSDGYLGALSALQGMTKDSLQSYFTTAGNYGLTTTNNVAYIEITDYYYSSIYGVLIEFMPASEDSGSSDDSVSFISVTADGETCDLSVHGTYVSSAANMTNEIQVYKASATEGAAIVINKLADDGGDSIGVGRCAFAYGGTMGRAVYPVSVGSDYAVGDDAKAKFGLTTTNTVYYIEIGGQTRTPLYGLLIEFVPVVTSEKLTGITGTASSTDTSENLNVSYAFDGDYGTYWATAAGGSLTDSYLIANLGKTCTVNKVEYTKRYDSGALYNCTGNLLNYIIEVSTDGETWIKVAEGETDDGTTVIEFTPVQAAYVRLTSTGSYHWNSAQLNTVMCVAELAVYGGVSGGSDTPAPSTYTVTLPTGDGYSVAASDDSASPVAEGGSYSFTVTVADDYDGTNMVVKANDTVLTATNGVYTIENITANQEITVTGVEKKAVPRISVTVGGEAAELTALGNYKTSIRYKTDEIPVYMVSADEGETIVVSKGANGDGASLNYRRLWKFGASSDSFEEVNKNGFNFPVNSTYAINSNADAMAKFELTASNPVYYVEIGTSSEGTPLYGLLVEVIPAVPANSYTVTLPDGEGYSAAASGDSMSPVTEGGSYSFTVAVVYGYDSTNMVVKANDNVLTAADGVYTIENITANQEITVTGVTKTVQIDPSNYITVIVENTSGDGSVLLKPTRLQKADYVNDYVTDALRQAMGGYSNVKHESTWDDFGSLYTITGIYDASQSDSYLNNGDVDGYKWQVLINNEAWSGRDYNKDYKLKGGDVIRCIYTSEIVEDAAGGVSKDDLIQLAADVSDEIKTTKAYEDALTTIVSDTASETDVQNAITALQNAQVVKATSVQITEGDSVDLKVNKTLTLHAAILPANATDKPEWSSSNSNIVTVDKESGELKGIAEGKATVTVTCGSATDIVTVNVTDVPATGVTISNGDIETEQRFSVQLVATVTPEDSTDLVKWSVADESIATVDANGKLTGVGVGETTVTATAGTKTATVNVKVTETKSSYVYFKYSDGSVQEMKDDSFTLTVLDEGYFVVANTTAAATWACSEYVSAGGDEMQYNYWINSYGKYQPFGVKNMTATVQAGGYHKTFTIKTVPSEISEVKVYIDDTERNTEKSYEVTGMSNAVVTVKGKNEVGDWVYIPTQAVKIDISDTNIVQALGNQMKIIREGETSVTVSMLDNSEVSISFKVVCNPVNVTGINVVVPKVFYIDKWDSMGNVFIGLYKGYEDPDTQYYVNYEPSNATNQDLIWEDLTPEIAVYDEGWSTGIVPKKAGTAKFKVTSVSNSAVSQEVTIEFKYKTPLESAVSVKESYEMKVGDTITPELTFTPSNPTETSFNWTYSKDGIVRIIEKVESAGYSRVVSRSIAAMAEGTVTVTGTPVDSTANCKPVQFTVTVTGSDDTETIDYLKMAEDDMAHGLKYLQTRNQSDYGTEWTIFTNLRAGGSMDPQIRILYLQSVAAELKDKDANWQPTDYVRLVLTLPLLDVDPTDFEGINILEKLYNDSTLGNQTSNQICWTLLALDSRKYDIPADAQWSRDKLIEKILTFQYTDGSFGLDAGKAGSVDMTGMILQALAPYYNSSYPKVQTAIDKALEYLKEQMTANAGYIEGGAENACTAAQVLTALAALKIDPTDPANGFTIGTKNLITNLRSFIRDEGFAYLVGEDEGTNTMGTQQVTYALLAYIRYEKDQTALYDLSDLDGEGGNDDTPIIPGDDETPDDSGDDDSSSGDTEKDESITVYFTLLGDSEHDSDSDGKIHTLSKGNLTTWISRRAYTVDADATVKDVLELALSQNGMSCKNPTGNYVESITRNGVTIGEFTNGSLSGWMYTLDGTHPGRGVEEQRLSNGAEIVFHYTDDYTIEEGSSDYDEDSSDGDGDTGDDTTGGNTDSTTITVYPDTTVNAKGEAKVEVSRSDISSAITEASKNENIGSVTITPDVKGDATGISVELKADSVKKAADSDLDLTVTTDIAHVTIPNKSLQDINGELSITAEKTENGTVKVEIAVDGKTVDKIAGGIVVNVPAEKVGNTDVLVVVNEDGSETVIRNSVADDDGVSALFDCSVTVKVVDNAKTFADTESHWSSDAIEFTSSRELFKGIADGEFDPNGTMTRAMIVTILYRLEGEPTITAENPFTDVADGLWYTDAIIWAAENKIIEGYGNGTFGPKDSVTREHLATVIYRYSKYKGYDVTATNALTDYTDREKISDWALDAVKWANAEGLMIGRTETAIVPTDTATRAESATILMRFIKNCVNKY